MSLLPTDPASFFWGACAGAIGAFFVAVLTKAGEDFYLWLKQKLRPEPPAPRRVEAAFIPSGYDRKACAWAVEENLFDREREGYAVYSDPSSGAKLFRVSSDESKSVTEYLLVKKGASGPKSGAV